MPRETRESTLAGATKYLGDDDALRRELQGASGRHQETRDSHSVSLPNNRNMGDIVRYSGKYTGKEKKLKKRVSQAESNRMVRQNAENVARYITDRRGIPIRVSNTWTSAPKVLAEAQRRAEASGKRGALDDLDLKTLKRKAAAYEKDPEGYDSSDGEAPRREMGKQQQYSQKMLRTAKDAAAYITNHRGMPIEASGNLNSASKVLAEAQRRAEESGKRGVLDDLDSETLKRKAAVYKANPEGYASDGEAPRKERSEKPQRTRKMNETAKDAANYLIKHKGIPIEVSRQLDSAPKVLAEAQRRAEPGVLDDLDLKTLKRKAAAYKANPEGYASDDEATRKKPRRMGDIGSSEGSSGGDALPRGLQGVTGRQENSLQWRLPDGSEEPLFPALGPGEESLFPAFWAW